MHPYLKELLIKISISLPGQIYLFFPSFLHSLMSIHPHFNSITTTVTTKKQPKPT
jgi:hypothetical protein